MRTLTPGETGEFKKILGSDDFDFKLSSSFFQLPVSSVGDPEKKEDCPSVDGWIQAFPI